MAEAAAAGRPGPMRLMRAAGRILSADIRRNGFQRSCAYAFPASFGIVGAGWALLATAPDGPATGLRIFALALVGLPLWAAGVDPGKGPFEDDPWRPLNIRTGIVAAAWLVALLAALHGTHGDGPLTGFTICMGAGAAIMIGVHWTLSWLRGW